MMLYKLKNSNKAYSFLEAVILNCKKSKDENIKSAYIPMMTTIDWNFYLSIFAIPKENRLEFLRVYDVDWEPIYGEILL